MCSGKSDCTDLYVIKQKDWVSPYPHCSCCFARITLHSQQVIRCTKQNVLMLTVWIKIVLILYILTLNICSLWQRSFLRDIFNQNSYCVWIIYLKYFTMISFTVLKMTFNLFYTPVKRRDILGNGPVHLSIHRQLLVNTISWKQLVGLTSHFDMAIIPLIPRTLSIGGILRKPRWAPQ